MSEDDFTTWTTSDLLFDLSLERTVSDSIRRNKIEAEIEQRKTKIERPERTGVDRIPIGYISIFLGFICLFVVNPTIEDGIIISGPILTAVFSLPWYIALKLAVVLYKYKTNSTINESR
jgi:hypothetical protein